MRRTPSALSRSLSSASLASAASAKNCSIPSSTDRWSYLIASVTSSSRFMSRSTSSALPSLSICSMPDFVKANFIISEGIFDSANWRILLRMPKYSFIFTIVFGGMSKATPLPKRFPLLSPPRKSFVSVTLPIPRAGMLILRLISSCDFGLSAARKYASKSRTSLRSKNRTPSTVYGTLRASIASSRIRD